MEDGCEFLLVFDNGSFSENETFLITDLFAHTPRDVLALNFGVAKAAFANIPIDVEHERYIFAGEIPGRLAGDTVRSAAGIVPNTFSHRMMAQEPILADGGWVRITDSTNFPAASTIAAALVHIEPGAMREIHWHLTESSCCRAGCMVSGSGYSARPAFRRPAMNLSVSAGFFNGSRPR
jgi:oxalate decarboxylase